MNLTLRSSNRQTKKHGPPLKDSSHTVTAHLNGLTEGGLSGGWPSQPLLRFFVMLSIDFGGLLELILDVTGPLLAQLLIGVSPDEQKNANCHQPCTGCRASAFP